eukprot:c25848_g1_i1 orf=101-1612(+)
MEWGTVGLLSLWLWASHIGLVASSVHEYANRSFANESNAFIFNGGIEGMYVSIYNGSSYIRFESVVFTRTEEAARKYTSMEARTQLIQAIVFEVRDRDKIGSRTGGGSYALCCTQDLVKAEGCEPGEAIIHSVEGWPRLLSFHFKGNQVDSTPTIDPIEITKTGMYSLYFIFCDPQLHGTVINGKTIWKNPYGYLPGRLAPLMKFYGILSVAYLILALIWLSQYIRFWRDILQLQNYISLVIALCMCEMTLWYFDYTNFNSTGYRPASITLWAVSLGTLRKTVSHCLILFVSMGYDVVRPTLGGLTSRVLVLATAYFIAAEVFEVMENVGAINDMARKEKLLLVLPVAVLDTVFIAWIFTSLSKTLEKLLARKLTAKLGLYRSFTNTLALGVVTSIAWMGFELFSKALDPFNERWQNDWIILSFWNAISFILLCVICILWAPSRNATRYAYSEEGLENFDMEESIALISVGGSLPTVAEAKGEKRVAHGEIFHTENNYTAKIE